MATLIILLALWTAFLLMYRSEPRRLANAAVLLPTVLLTFSTISEFLTSHVPGAGFILALLLVSLPLILLIFAFVLIYNGILMWRREGRRIANLLSLFCGVLVLLLPVLAVLLVRTQHWFGLATAFILFMGTIFTAMIFVMVLLYAWVYARFTVRGTPQAVVVLGARTIKGQITPLLRSRLDRGIELFRSRDSQDVWMVPTGGQGPDEIEPEGETMARYLLEQGIDESRILIEDQARDTDENLLFSQRLLEQQGQKTRMWIVTNDYHSLRAGLASHRLGLDAASFGAKTARYYRPSAFLREFIAIVRDHWVTVTVLAIPFAAVLGLALIFSLNQ
ncbi:YdcF family protein [Glutamicibacter uratoxydans]|uniref:YdcF family protein n=1 Tax=Glutamicibacter uratoxydans TaxID=43667 RepID=UPI003D6EAF28